MATLEAPLVQEIDAANQTYALPAEHAAVRQRATHDHEPGRAGRSGLLTALARWASVAITARMRRARSAPSREELILHHKNLVDLEKQRLDYGRNLLPITWR